MQRTSGSTARILLVLFSILALLLIGNVPSAVPDTQIDVIVQAGDTTTAARTVARYDGQVTRELPIIDSVVATVDADAVVHLRNDDAIRAVWHNAEIEVTGRPDRHRGRWRSRYALPPEHYASVASGAVDLHAEGITGKDVTIAIVDSGLPFNPLLNPRRSGRPRGAPRDGSLFFRHRGGQFILYKDFIDRRARHSKDPFGHGSHVTGSIVGSIPISLEGEEQDTARIGVAPDANLVVARAIGDDGRGTYADVIEAIGWIVEMRDAYDVDVLNLSIEASVKGPYWLDPMNQAVMKAWQAGITVVAAAGNNGTDPVSIGAPGNIPYVITVGAYREAEYNDSGNPELLDFSSRGPTESRFVKPDVLLPGWQIVAPMPKRSYLAQQIGESTIDDRGRWRASTGFLPHMGYYPLSGTSMSTAQAAGIVALMLEQDPSLSNDQIKSRLMQTASIAFDEENDRAVYSIWEQGAGRVNAYDAVFSTGDAVANEGLDIDADLDTGPDGIHYLGFTGIEDDTGAFVIGEQTEPEGYFRWTGANDVDDSGTWAWSGGHWAWSGGTWAWSGGNWAWSGGTWAWSGATWAWSGGHWAWSGGTWAWSGSNWTWTSNEFVEVDGNWVWSGGHWAWSGGTWAWSGGNWAWTGGTWAWSGATPIDEHTMRLSVMPAQ